MKRSEIIQQIKEFVDPEFAKSEMHLKILNTKQVVLGVRTPKMKELARKLSKSGWKATFLTLKDEFWEETVLAGLLLSKNKDINESFLMLKDYCGRIDNWATCDQVCGAHKIFRKDIDNKYFKQFLDLSLSKDEFVARVGLIMLMLYYLKDECIDEILGLLSKISNHKYYVDMAVAWLISYAIVKYPQKTISLLKTKTLTKFVQNKAICKCRDSFRVPKETKEELIAYRIK